MNLIPFIYFLKQDRCIFQSASIATAPFLPRAEAGRIEQGLPYKDTEFLHIE